MPWRYSSKGYSQRKKTARDRTGERLVRLEITRRVIREELTKTFEAIQDGIQLQDKAKLAEAFTDLTDFSERLKEVEGNWRSLCPVEELHVELQGALEFSEEITYWHCKTEKALGVLKDRETSMVKGEVWETDIIDRKVRKQSMHLIKNCDSPVIEKEKGTKNSRKQSRVVIKIDDSPGVENEETTQESRDQSMEEIKDHETSKQKVEDFDEVLEEKINAVDLVDAVEEGKEEQLESRKDEPQKSEKSDDEETGKNYKRRREPLTFKDDERQATEKEKKHHQEPKSKDKHLDSKSKDRGETPKHSSDVKKESDDKPESENFRENEKVKDGLKDKHKEKQKDKTISDNVKKGGDKSKRDGDKSKDSPKDKHREKSKDKNKDKHSEKKEKIKTEPSDSPKSHAPASVPSIKVKEETASDDDAGYNAPKVKGIKQVLEDSDEVPKVKEKKVKTEKKRKVDSEDEYSDDEIRRPERVKIGRKFIKWKDKAEDNLPQRNSVRQSIDFEFS